AKVYSPSHARRSSGRSRRSTFWATTSPSRSAIAATGGVMRRCGGADLPGIHSICVDPRNSKRVWIAGSTGGIWFPEDGGASWTLRGEGMRAEYAPPEQTHDPIAQDVHCLAQCPAAPQRMWVQHHNGIFVSSDEGKTFAEITGVEPSAFGFPVVVHPRE